MLLIISPTKMARRIAIRMVVQRTRRRLGRELISIGARMHSTRIAPKKSLNFFMG